MRTCGRTNRQRYRYSDTKTDIYNVNKFKDEPGVWLWAAGHFRHHEGTAEVRLWAAGECHTVTLHTLYKLRILYNYLQSRDFQSFISRDTSTVDIKNKARHPGEYGGLCGLVTLAACANIALNVCVGWYVIF